jgi:hypothetical protein
MGECAANNDVDSRLGERERGKAGAGWLMGRPAYGIWESKEMGKGRNVQPADHDQAIKWGGIGDRFD